ncbi:sigma-54-dependent Fis family transcriptional regulator [Nocardia salmonicida]|uniref:sigma-54-dependent Fis family transcriptional regulator n=1 Tax=Nocardia salmonicida TaxID=53431 RepID=UPI0033FE563C
MHEVSVDVAFAKLAAEHGDLRPEIAQSWRRSMGYRVRRDATSIEPWFSAAEPDRRLLSAAMPVMDHLASDIAGTGLVVGLADSAGRLLDARWSGRLPTGRALESAGIVLGSTMCEERIGTNAIGTVVETRTAITIRGPEHYLRSIESMSCYGHPIVDPVTGRLSGVMMMGAGRADYSPLFRPYMEHAAHAIERGLLDSSRAGDRGLLRAFRRVVSRSSHPVVAFGADLILTNAAAHGVLRPEDQARLRQLSEETTISNPGEVEVEVAGRFAAVRMYPVAGFADSWVFELLSRSSLPSSHPRNRGRLAQLDEDLADVRARRVNVVLRAEPGAGASRAMTVLAEGKDASWFELAEIARIGREAWLQAFEATMRRRPGLVLIEAGHLADSAVARVVARHLPENAQFVVSTCGELHPALHSLCPVTITLPPTRACRTELPALIAATAAELRPNGDVYLTPDAISALAARRYRGNFTELRAAIVAALSTRSVGPITQADLVPSGTELAYPAGLTRLEQVEYDEIVEALRRHNGNRASAAAELGFSRSTLHRRIRAFRLG